MQRDPVAGRAVLELRGVHDQAACALDADDEQDRHQGVPQDAYWACHRRAVGGRFHDGAAERH